MQIEQYTNKLAEVFSQTSVVLGLIFLTIFVPLAASAEEDTTTTGSQAARVRLDANTIKKGFTLETPNQDFRLGVTPSAVGERDSINVALKPVKKKTVSLKGETLLSDLYSFDIFHKDTVPVYKPIWLTLNWTKDTDEGIVLKNWDSNLQAWVEMPSNLNFDEQRVQAAIHLPYAIVGVFEDKRPKMEGQASWYDWHGAAMNDLPMGTEIRVTNPENGKSAVTTIVSTGPFVHNRIIDLPKFIFAEIGDLSSGVMHVVITPLTD